MPLLCFRAGTGGGWYGLEIEVAVQERSVLVTHLYNYLESTVAFLIEIVERCRNHYQFQSFFYIDTLLFY